MDYKEAADRIEEHMIAHHMAEYPHAVRITEALGIAVKLLREAAGVKEPTIEECARRFVEEHPYI